MFLLHTQPFWREESVLPQNNIKCYGSYLDHYLIILTYACRYTQTHQVQWHISSRKPFCSSYMYMWTIWTTSCFSDIFIQPRSNPHCSIFHATFNKYPKFHTVLLQMHGINCICMPGDKCLPFPPWHTFLCKYWQVWSFIHVCTCISMHLQKILKKCHQFTTWSIVNWFTHVWSWKVFLFSISTMKNVKKIADILWHCQSGLWVTRGKHTSTL